MGVERPTAKKLVIRKDSSLHLFIYLECLTKMDFFGNLPFFLQFPVFLKLEFAEKNTGEVLWVEQTIWCLEDDWLEVSHGIFRCFFFGEALKQFPLRDPWDERYIYQDLVDSYGTCIGKYTIYRCYGELWDSRPVGLGRKFHNLAGGAMNRRVSTQFRGGELRVFSSSEAMVEFRKSTLEVVVKRKRHHFLIQKWWVLLPFLGGGGNSNMFYFHLETWGRWIHFDEHIFQMGWFNHQPVLDDDFYPLLKWWNLETQPINKKWWKKPQGLPRGFNGGTPGFVAKEFFSFATILFDRGRECWRCFFGTPLKINMEHNNEGLEDHFPF